MNDKIYLNVPYEEKEHAKQFGAKWDANLKLWYVIGNEDFSLLEKVSKWFFKYRYKINCPLFLIEVDVKCSNCGHRVPVQCLSIDSKNISENDSFLPPERNYVLLIKYLMELDPTMLSLMLKHTKTYKRVFSKTYGEYVYMNHCKSCRFKIGDNFLHTSKGCFSSQGLPAWERYRLCDFGEFGFSGQFTPLTLPQHGLDQYNEPEPGHCSAQVVNTLEHLYHLQTGRYWE